MVRDIMKAVSVQIQSNRYSIGNRRVHKVFKNQPLLGCRFVGNALWAVRLHKVPTQPL